MSYLKISRRMIGIACAILLLVGCGAHATAPQPGASFSGTINVGDKAGSGWLSFTIAQNGGALTNLLTSLQKVNCKDMISMGSVENYASDPGISVTKGIFEASLPAMGGMIKDFSLNLGNPRPTPVPDPDTVGKITGRFTTSTTATGTITIFLGAPMSGGIVCELGTFDWSASAQ